MSYYYYGNGAVRGGITEFRWGETEVTDGDLIGRVNQSIYSPPKEAGMLRFYRGRGT